MPAFAFWEVVKLMYFLCLTYVNILFYYLFLPSCCQGLRGKINVHKQVAIEPFSLPSPSRKGGRAESKFSPRWNEAVLLKNSVPFLRKKDESFSLCLVPETAEVSELNY